MKSKDQNPKLDSSPKVIDISYLDHIEIMDVKDINKYREFKSSRITNPLEPVYTGQDEDGFLIYYKSKQSHSIWKHPRKQKQTITSSNY